MVELTAVAKTSRVAGMIRLTKEMITIDQEPG